MLLALLFCNVGTLMLLCVLLRRCGSLVFTAFFLFLLVAVKKGVFLSVVGNSLHGVTP